MQMERFYPSWQETIGDDGCQKLNIERVEGGVIKLVDFIPTLERFVS